MAACARARRFAPRGSVCSSRRRPSTCSSHRRKRPGRSRRSSMTPGDGGGSGVPPERQTAHRRLARRRISRAAGRSMRRSWGRRGNRRRRPERLLRHHRHGPEQRRASARGRVRRPRLRRRAEARLVGLRQLLARPRRAIRTGHGRPVPRGRGRGNPGRHAVHAGSRSAPRARPPRRHTMTQRRRLRASGSVPLPDRHAGRSGERRRRCSRGPARSAGIGDRGLRERPRQAARRRRPARHLDDRHGGRVPTRRSRSG